MEELSYENDPAVTYESDMNVLNPNKESDMMQYQRLMVQGKCMRLPSTPNIPDSVYQSWLYTFMNEIKDDTNEKAKLFRYTWFNEEDSDDLDRVPYGVPGSAKQIVSLLKSGQVTKDMIDPPISQTLYNKAIKVTNATWTLTAIANEGDDKASKPILIEATAEDVRKLFDKIINLWSGNYYETAAAFEYPNTPGGVTQLYFDDYKDNIKIMRAAHAEGAKFLPIDMVSSFKAGIYKNYKQVIAAVKRRYGRCRTQDTMMDFFRKLDTAFERRTRHEFKIQELRNILQKQYITEETEFPDCKDFESDICRQKYPEEYSPIINTLLTYILFKNNVPKNKWDSFQKEFYGSINGKPTYRAWHENRAELWSKLDEEVNISRKESINMVSTEQTDLKSAFENLDEEGFEEYVALVRRSNQRKAQKLQPNRTFPNNNTNSNNRNRNSPAMNRQRFVPNYNRNPAAKNYSARRPTKVELQRRVSSMLCMHCTRVAGVNKYHEGPYGGGPESNCPYDKGGNRRPNKKFVSHIFEVSVDDLGIPDVKEFESEGLSYEDQDDLEQSENALGIDLLTGALGHYDVQA